MAETESLEQKIERIKEFWNARAALGEASGSNDVIGRRVETDALSSYVQDGMRIVEVGCGAGLTAIYLASNFQVEIIALDYAPAMIASAERSAATERLKGKITFACGDVRDLPRSLAGFDLAYTQRALINLPTWELQKQAISAIGNALRPGGAYVMCENSEDGLADINALRQRLQLGAISPPWHNRYFRDGELKSAEIPGLSLEDVNHFCGIYDFLSRVVNAWLAARENQPPRYDAPVNELALHLPPLFPFGQTKIWLWRKKQA